MITINNQKPQIQLTCEMTKVCIHSIDIVFTFYNVAVYVGVCVCILFAL